MHRLVGARQHYAWGSRSAIPQLVGEPPSDEPLAELWFGAHPAGPTRLASGESLQEHLAAAPEERLGSDVLAVFGPRLPYLVKVIAPASPLSLQVHPSREQAREGFAREEARGVAPDAPHRSYPDDNHKPEMLYALEPFEALAGFRAARRAVELLRDLDTVLARELVADLRSDLGGAGVRAAFTRLLDPATRPGADAIAETVEACAARLAAGRSPSVRSDRIVAQLAEAFPGDVGAVASLLMNPVSLRPGEVLFVPAGGVHCYLSGLAVEVMASSDNVLRAALTRKHVDTEAVLDTVDCVAAPPVRIGPEHVGDHVEVFYAPVDDFELAVATPPPGEPVALPGRGPRIVFALDGRVRVAHGDDALELERGGAAFVEASGEPVVVDGEGRAAQVTVP